MKIRIPKVIKEIPLAEHAPEYGGATIQVWVNPGEDDLERFEQVRLELLSVGDEISKAEGAEDMKALAERMSQANQSLNEWYAHIWSQGSDAASHWTAAEVRELAENALENDPKLWQFVQERTFLLIGQYRGGGYRKKSRTTSSRLPPQEG